MKRSFILMLVVAVVAMAFTPALLAQDSLIESVCLVTDVGKVDDGTFNQFAYEGMLAAADDFGLESNVIETTSPTEYNDNIVRCVDSGFDTIITVGFLLQDATLANAEANPDVYFIGVDQGYEAPPANLVGVQFREDQSGFIAGALAALMSESGSVAGVYGIDVPAVKKFRNGFEQGAKYINPDIAVSGVYIDSFVDSARGGETARQLISEGADVIFGAGGQTGSGGIQAAAAEGVYVIGVDQDEYVTTFGNGETPGAEFVISSAVKRVDQGVYLPIEALVNGDLAAFGGGGTKVLSASNDGIGFAEPHDSDVSEDVTAQLEEIFAGLQDGSIVTGVDPVLGDMLPSIAEIVAGNEDFSTLLAAVEAAGLGETLTTGGPFTVFAPTNAAFDALPEGALDGLLADTDALTSVLLYHVVSGAVPAETVVTLDGAEVPTMDMDQPITISVTDMGVVLNGSVNVVTTDILASNGIIHVIDAVLMPAEGM